MKRTLFQILLPGLVLCFASCATTGNTPAQNGAPKKEASAKDKERKLADLAFDLDIARAKLEIARLEMEAFEAEQATQMREAEANVALAEAELAHYDRTVAPSRLASEELNLRSTKDRAQEAADELEQIEIMYKDQDLDDLTAEFVVSRGRRNAERAQARIEIQERELAGLKEHELPTGRRRLEMKVEGAKDALASAVRSGEIKRSGKEIALREAQRKVESLERDLAEMKAEGAEG